MGHNQLKKCSKYHLVSLLTEKQRSTFANFLHLFLSISLLTNSAMMILMILVMMMMIAMMRVCIAHWAR